MTLMDRIKGILPSNKRKKLEERMANNDTAIQWAMRFGKGDMAECVLYYAARGEPVSEAYAKKAANYFSATEKPYNAAIIMESAGNAEEAIRFYLDTARNNCLAYIEFVEYRGGAFVCPSYQIDGVVNMATRGRTCFDKAVELAEKAGKHEIAVSIRQEEQVYDRAMNYGFGQRTHPELLGKIEWKNGYPRLILDQDEIEKQKKSGQKSKVREREERSKNSLEMLTKKATRAKAGYYAGLAAAFCGGAVVGYTDSPPETYAEVSGAASSLIAGALAQRRANIRDLLTVSDDGEIEREYYTYEWGGEVRTGPSEDGGHFWSGLAVGGLLSGIGYGLGRLAKYFG